MCFEFPFNLIRKSTMPFLTRKSWCVLKSWFTSGTGISVVFSSFQSCCHNFKTFGLKIIPLFVFITCDSTAVGIRTLGQAVCWGRRTHNSQFARKIFPLLYNNCFKHQLNIQSSFHCFCLWKVFFNSLMVVSVVTELKSALYMGNFSPRKLQGTGQLSNSKLRHLIGSYIFLLFINRSQFSNHFPEKFAFYFVLFAFCFVIFALCPLKKCSALRKSDSRNFFMYIINCKKVCQHAMVI